jgi:triacylglycerol lipase
MRVYRVAVAATLLGILFLGQPFEVLAKSPKVDFSLLYRAAQMSNLAYDGKGKILGKLKGKRAWVATPGNADVQYFIGYNHKRKVQGISVRGTANDDNWSQDKDSKGVRDKKTGILMHRGFRTGAQAIYKDVKSHLKPGYKTYLTGHSLGGAIAAIIGIYLQKDGVKIAGIYTFGQPKFTDVAGAKAHENLPLLRVIHQNDTVALLPDSDSQGNKTFAHIGAAINLLKGPYYAYATAAQTLQVSQGSFDKFMTQISLPDHKIKWYLQNLRDKLKGTKRVSFKDREKYIVRHKYGSGVDTAPVKHQFNFNHHN